MRKKQLFENECGNKWQGFTQSTTFCCFRKEGTETVFSVLSLATTTLWPLGVLLYPLFSETAKSGGLGKSLVICFHIHFQKFFLILLEHRTRAEYCVNLGLKRWLWKQKVAKLLWTSHFLRFPLNFKIINSSIKKQSWNFGIWIRDIDAGNLRNVRRRLWRFNVALQF